jgi:CDP-diglyceride synthetase
MSRRKIPALLQLGCAHLVALLLVTSVLLIVDTFVVTIAYRSWLEFQGEKRPDPRLAQTVLISGPLLLLFLQYWLYDRVRDWLLRPRLDS